MQSNKVYEQLARVAGDRRRIVRVLTVFDAGNEWVEGFVMEVSEELVILAKISPDLYLDGYEILRTGNVDRVMCPAPYAAAQLAILNRRRQRPWPLNIDISSMKTAARAIGKMGRVVIAVYREDHAPGACNLGVVESATSANIVLRNITPAARWGDAGTYRYRDISRIKVGGGYEEGYASIVPWDKRPEVRASAQASRRRRASGGPLQR